MKNSINRLLPFSFLCCIVLIISSCGTNSKDVKSEITKANKAFMEAFNKGDAKLVAGFYTETAKLFPANSEVIEGKKAIEGFWGGAMKMGVKKAELNTRSAEQYGDIAIEEGTYQLYAPNNAVIDHGKYVVTWKKESGQWSIQRDIWNTLNPAPRTIAAENETVWIITYCVKGDKAKKFEEINFNYLLPAAIELNPQVRKTVRMLRPTDSNSDGSKIYTYLFEGVKKGSDYDMLSILKAKYGEAKSKEYYQQLLDCLSTTRIGQKIVGTQTAL